jgi:uncharacterized protein YprB with RNaseH-like and TPR domain
MKIKTQTYLDLVEQTNKLCFWDLETTGLNGDYHTIVIASVLGYKDKKPHTITAQAGADKKLVEELLSFFMKSSYTCMTGYYSKGFDLPFLRTRALRWGLNGNNPDILLPEHHLDMYFTLKPKFKMSSNSQAKYLDILEADHRKMSVPPQTWGEAAHDPKKMAILVKRCESDVIGLRDLYKKTRCLIKEINAT